MTVNKREVAMHGHRLSYLDYNPPKPGQEAEAVVLLHGIAGSNRTWAAALAELARRGFPHRLIAPDLPGHGASDAPRGDYSLGAQASVVRDLITLLGHESATIVGHSLGGGIAMQFAYQYPQHCGRLVLVDSGGFGRAVTPLLRATALPGTAVVLPVIAHRGLMKAGGALGVLGRRLGVRFSAETVEIAQHFASLSDPARRRAFLAEARGVLDLRGQRASAIDRLYLSGDMPTMILWGDKDPIIPVGHAYRANRLIPNSRLEIFDGVGHFPHAAEPVRFADLMVEFLEDTTPARLDLQHFLALLAAQS